MKFYDPLVSEKEYEAGWIEIVWVIIASPFTLGAVIAFYLREYSLSAVALLPIMVFIALVIMEAAEKAARG